MPSSKDRIGDLFHPISVSTHFHGAKEIEKFTPRNVLDIGGVGKCKEFLRAEVYDANKQNGIDGTCLPYEDNAFDVTCSFSTLEHVGNFKKQKKFLNESFRVCRLGSVHWFPYGGHAKSVEKYKAKIPKYNHKCTVPQLEVIEDLDIISYTYQSVQEHLLLLSTIHPQFNTIKLYEFLEDKYNAPYGLFIVYRKIK